VGGWVACCYEVGLGLGWGVAGNMCGEQAWIGKDSARSSLPCPCHRLSLSLLLAAAATAPWIDAAIGPLANLLWGGVGVEDDYHAVALSLAVLSIAAAAAAAALARRILAQVSQLLLRLSQLALVHLLGEAQRAEGLVAGLLRGRQVHQLCSTSHWSGQGMVG